MILGRLLVLRGPKIPRDTLWFPLQPTRRNNQFLFSYTKTREVVLFSAQEQIFLIFFAENGIERLDFAPQISMKRQLPPSAA